MHSTNIYDRFSFWSLFLTIALLPIFFLPFTNIPIETEKGLLLVVGLVLSIIFWSIARFIDGKIILPKSSALLAGAGIVLAFFLSSIFSAAIEVSLFGTMFDIGTFWFIFCAFLLMLMSSIIFRDPKNAKVVLFGAIFSSALVLIFQAAHLFVPQSLSLGVLAGKTSSIFGSWNALGIFAGFSALMSMLVAEFFLSTRWEKWVLEIFVIFCLIMVAIVNFGLVWGLVGISGLIIFVYKVSAISGKSRAEGEKRYFPTLSFAIILISLLFFISGQSIGGILPEKLGLENNEISPLFSATMQITKSTLKQNPLFGIGPNKFGVAWAKYKPQSINNTSFWDINFNSGSGLLPTLAATTGGLGILAFLLFFALFIASGIKSIFFSIKNRANWETMAFFVLSLYLFISSFFYSVGTVIFLLALAFGGVFIGLSASRNPKEEISIAFLNDHRKSFFSILFLALIVIISASLSFKYIERFTSVFYFGKAVTSTTVPAAESSINRALSLYVNDLYLRTFSQIHLVKISTILQKGESSLNDTDKADIKTSVDQTVSGAVLATSYDPKNYQNFQTLGSVYQSLASIGIQDASGKAVEAYTQASLLNPLNPGIKVDLATVFLAEGKTAEAKDNANAALELKPDFIDAYIVLAQIAKQSGDSAGALSYAQIALSLDPENENIKKYVETLKNQSSPVSPSSTTPQDSSTKEQP